jgi:hypothetical protein
VPDAGFVQRILGHWFTVARTAPAHHYLSWGPPTVGGVRGIDEYRDSWAPFFAWQAAGAVFERDSQQRLRLSIGLTKRDGRWIVRHEHHSFTDTSAPVS